MWWTNSESIPGNEDFGTLAEYDPLTGYEPNDYHISETIEPYIQESSGENGSLNSHVFEYDDYTIGMAFYSPLFRSEKIQGARRLVSDEFGSVISKVQENPRRDSDNNQIRILERQKEQIRADCHAEIRKYEFQADHHRRSIQKLNEMIESQKEESYRAHQGDEQFRRDQQLPYEQLLEQIRKFCEVLLKSSMKCENSRDFRDPHYTQL